MLSVENLAVSFHTRSGQVDAVRNVSFALDQGETLGIVGESGSGKSVTAYSLMRILDSGGSIGAGEAIYSGVDLRRASEPEMKDLRGREISMIFQNPRMALNPIRKIGHQLEDVLRRHGKATRHTAYTQALAALEAVKIHNPASRYHAYPFELSGGMCQRVVIAIALACDPRLLLADEPTTGLDITTQRIVMDLVVGLIRGRSMSAVLITHDLGLAAEYCDRIVVMKDGVIVEQGIPSDIFGKPSHAYTQALVDATPRQSASIRSLLPAEQRKPEVSPVISNQPILEVHNLSKVYAGKLGPVHAVKDISFSISGGQSVGLVGESGCGKSTTAEILVRLLDPSGGEIIFEGDDIAQTPSREFARHPIRTDLQMIFQDATDSLNPRHSAAQCIVEPLKRLTALDSNALRIRTEELASLVGLPQHLLDRFPHQLSGGQKARVGIARAIALQPKLLVLDEPTAALDVSIQAMVLNLLVDLRVQLGMTYLFVSHDLHVVRLLCDSVIVMRAGEIVESGSVASVMNNPQHPYTQALLAAAPRPPVRSQ